MTIAHYRSYSAARKALPPDGRMMPYRWSGLPEKVNVAWMPYGLMFDEFACELANTVNDLTTHVRRLRAWASVLEGLSDKDKLAATHEFVDVLATVAVNLPYVIRSRFIFATAHLCHQANRAKTEGAWQDDLALDKDIYMDKADHCGAPWRAYRGLKLRLEAISAKEFQRRTQDFRHSYNHRFSPRFVIGETQFVKRRINPKSGKTSYALGAMPPLGLDLIVELLAAERDRSYAAFEAFQKLIREHERAIIAWHARAPERRRGITFEIARTSN